MGRVIINGVSIEGGRNIIVRDNKVIVDGIDVTPSAKEVNIFVDGNVDKLEVDACNRLTVNHDADNVHTQSGDVEVAGEIKGSVLTQSGDVSCGGSIGGSVSTQSGDINHH